MYALAGKSWGMTMSAAKRVGRPPNPVPPVKPSPWEAPAVAQRLEEILVALEVPAIQPEVRRFLQRMLWRYAHLAKHFQTKDDSAGRVTLLIRTILESEGNDDALIEPIVSAVWGAMEPAWTNLGLKWIEAFDQIPLMATLQTMRSLNLFGERSMAHYLSMVIRNKLFAILEPLVSRPAPVRAKPKAKRPKRRDQPVRMAA
jgi:hypothetical protein